MPPIYIHNIPQRKIFVNTELFRQDRIAASISARSDRHSSMMIVCVTSTSKCANHIT